MLREVVDSKKALNKLAELVEAQGGDKNAVYNKELLPKASIIREFVAKHDGYVSHIECDEVGKAAMVLGGGRENKDSIIDLSVGIVLHKKLEILSERVKILRPSTPMTRTDLMPPLNVLKMLM